MKVCARPLWRHKPCTQTADQKSSETVATMQHASKSQRAASRGKSVAAPFGVSTSSRPLRRDAKRRTVLSTVLRKGAAAAVKSWQAAEDATSKAWAPLGPGTVCEAMVRRVVPSANVCVCSQVPHAEACESIVLRPEAYVGMSVTCTMPVDSSL